MVRIYVLYPHTPGARFDFDYYAGTHMDMVRERFSSHGLLNINVDRGIAGGRRGSDAPYCCVGLLTFETLDGYKQAFKTHGADLLADIPNFTDITPEVQISEVVL